MQRPRRNPEVRYMKAEPPAFELPAIRGETYEAAVPDTLDLAERAAAAVHGLTATTDPDCNAEIYWFAEFGFRKPSMYHDFNDWCEYKYYAPSMLLRQACGSDEAMDVEWHRMANLLQMQAPDGLLYIPTSGRPWAEDFGGGGPMYATDLGAQFCSTAQSGRMLEAAAIYYALTGERQWRDLVEKSVAALAGLMVDRGDFGYMEKIIHKPGDVRQDGPIPPPTIHHGQVWLAETMPRVFRLTGIEQALDLGHKLARFFLSHSAFVGPNGEFRSNHGAPDAAVPGMTHFHTNTLIRAAMLVNGLAAGDGDLVDLARVGYEFGKAHGDTLMGYFPEMLDENDCGEGFTCEICEVADMIYLAREMSLAGVADYWDDVDRWTRNMLAEAQLLETDWAYEFAAKHPTESQHPHAVAERVPERCRGIWGGWIAPNDWQGSATASMMACCVGNMARQSFMVWRDIVQWKELTGRLWVHLLTNRATPWADISSHIPCRGQVDVRAKVRCEVALRIPEWVERRTCSCEVNGVAARPRWKGRYAVVPVGPGDELCMHFPIAERRETVRLGPGYEVVVRGNEIVDISPPGANHPIFQRPKLRTDEARMRKVARFVADDVLWAF